MSVKTKVAAANHAPKITLAFEWLHASWLLVSPHITKTEIQTCGRRGAS
jgi:hypothetical protein